MNRQKKSVTVHPASQQKPKTAPGVPLIVLFWGAGLGLVGYIGSRFVFTPHPLHWASAVGGALLGILIGTIWYLKRGDVDIF
jgi:CHASE2 domain-containing sensor protein